jgi:Peroxisomal biogenesis factor 11 (PEX11)
MRFGKSVEHFKAAAVTADAKAMDPVLRYCAVGRQLGYAGYLTLDSITVVCRRFIWIGNEGWSCSSTPLPIWRHCVW